MRERTQVVLADVLQKKGYIRGPFGSALRRPEMKSEGIPVYEQQQAIYNTRDFRFFIDAEKFETLKRFQVETNDLLISCSGTVGKVTIIREDDPKGIISQALLILRADTSKVLPEYLKYFFTSQQGYNAIVSRSTGSVQVNISKRDVIEKIPLSLPSIDEQQKIVNVLYTIDKKIETNTQINRNLYEQAVALFESMYQDYSERKIGELDIFVTDYVANGSFASLKENVSILEEKDYAYFIRNVDLKAKEFPRFVNQHSYEFLSKSKLVGGEVIISNVGDVGSVFLCPKLDGPMTLGNNMIMLTSPKHNNYLYLFFKSYIGQGKIDGITGGSAQPKFNKTDFKSLEINYPDDSQVDEFNEKTSALLDMISKLDEENKRLTALRDSLLPKLMSGELDVSNLDI